MDWIVLERRERKKILGVDSLLEKCGYKWVVLINRDFKRWEIWLCLNEDRLRKEGKIEVI